MGYDFFAEHDLQRPTNLREARRFFSASLQSLRAAEGMFKEVCAIPEPDGEEARAALAARVEEYSQLAQTARGALGQARRELLRFTAMKERGRK
jgi:hypothetical protein